MGESPPTIIPQNKQFGVVFGRGGMGGEAPPTILRIISFFFFFFVFRRGGVGGEAPPTIKGEQNIIIIYSDESLFQIVFIDRRGGMGGEAPPIILFNKQFSSFSFLKGGGGGGGSPPHRTTNDAF